MLLHNTSGAFFINVKSNYLTLFLLRFPLFFVFLNCIKMLFHMNTVLMQSGTCQSHFKRVFPHLFSLWLPLLPSWFCFFASCSSFFLYWIHPMCHPQFCSVFFPFYCFFYSYALSPILFAVAQWNVSLWHSFNLIELHMGIFILYI